MEDYKRMTQKELKNLVKMGVAKDITNESYDCLDDDRPIEKICTSKGTYGMNGGLIKGKSGQLYVITARNSLLFRFF